ncbi:CBU_0585 family protein [Legionella nagasakiensis]|uniref:CBU_0585 family protein n=1 Tax=Legionella nagasakiensis TaxID=535290 RepID=UPI001054E83F|nr:CBU_0585 family protein [Legionella nagasakiensis]
MSSQDIDKAYVSPYDRFLYQFDATHEKSASQLKEIKKHQRIFTLRDHAEPAEREEAIWKDF